MGNIRVLHAPENVGGNPQGLSRALNKLGVASRVLVLSQTVFHYKADVVVWNLDDRLPVREIKRILAMFRFLPEADVVHYNFGTTMAAPPFFGPWKGRRGLKTLLRYGFCLYGNILNFLELTYLRFTKKPIFVTYQGDDARQGEFCKEHFKYNIADQVDDTYYNLSTDVEKASRIRRLAQYAEKIYAVNPDLLYVLPKESEFIPYSHILLDEWRPVYTQGEDRPLRFVHAPTHRQVKGTKYVLNAVESLRQECFEFEFLLVEGMSNQEARTFYEQADVLVDQLFAGWYGGLAVELMALGKPVVVYIREEDLKFIPDEMRQDLPFVQVTTETIKDGLLKILTMPREELLALAKRSRAFVERWHDPLNIAKRIKFDYERALLARCAPRPPAQRCCHDV
jgi:glycosyltransferase involved in cell wall biosynthesis